MKRRTKNEGYTNPDKVTVGGVHNTHLKLNEAF